MSVLVVKSNWLSPGLEGLIRAEESLLEELTLESLERHDSYLFTGIDQGVEYDEASAFLSYVFEQDKPLLAFGEGLILAAMHLGLPVFKLHKPLTGWETVYGQRYKARLTSKGKSDPLFKGVPPRFQVYHSTQRNLSVPREFMARVEVLATGLITRYEALRLGSKQYGFLGHLSMPPVGLPERDAEAYKENAELILNNFLALVEQPVAEQTF